MGFDVGFRLRKNKPKLWKQRCGTKTIFIKLNKFK